MATFPDIKPAYGVWNTVTDPWNATPFYWSWFPPKRKGESGDADTDLLDDEDWLLEARHPWKKRLKNDYAKIFMTVHNQFLTEEQRWNMRIAKIYPTYKAIFEIKRENGLLKENQSSDKVGIKVVKTKIGLESI